jgi:hypothetical protein
MRRLSWPLFAGFAIVCSTALAQQTVQQPTARPSAQQPGAPQAAQLQVVPQPAPPPSAQPVAPQPSQPPTPPQPAPPPPPAPQPEMQEGFFRPADDPALNPAPVPFAEPTNISRPGTLTVSPEVARAFADQVAAREALERELDRAQREHDRARADAARRPAPMIVSPLDGTAPIVSPLDR